MLKIECLKELTKKKSPRRTHKQIWTTLPLEETVKTLFKNQGDSGGMVSKIEATEKEIEAMNVLHEYITIYLGETVVPEFKQRKLKIYSKIIQ